MSATKLARNNRNLVSVPGVSILIYYFSCLGDLLRFLMKKKPKDAFCIVGITMIDLYPKESWNFVFGQASLTEGILG